MRQVKLFLLLCFFIFSPTILGKNAVVYYEPKIVELTGVIKMLTFPGPPNYENIYKGDAYETGAYLILKKPINVIQVPHIEMGNDELEKNVKIIQLVVNNNKDWEKIKEGSHVKIKGTIFRAIFAHHHSRVLFEIKSIRRLPEYKIKASDLTITKEDYKFMTDSEQVPKLTLKIMS